MRNAQVPHLARPVPRLRQWIGVALSGLVVGGCSVVDEVNNIGKDPNAQPAPAPAAETAAPAAPEDSAQAKLRAYYSREGKNVEQDPNDPIVNCRVSGGTQFMRKNDCISRGGRVLS